MRIDFRSIMSGQRKDPLAVLLRGGLWFASKLYGIVVCFRNHQYDHGKREVRACGVPVISVGNLTTGGTGKTPVVCFLAKRLRAKGMRVAIVSRGYGRGDADANDEAIELHARLPDVPHLQDPNRVNAAVIAVEELETEIILLDDGFQHRRLQRDFDLLVIDASEPFGYGHLLPRGLLREPIRSIRRADLVILSRCDAVDDHALDAIQQTIRTYNADIPIVQSCHQPKQLLVYPDQELPIEQLQGRSVAVVSAIGNPAAFQRTLRQCGADVVEAYDLPDHDPYSPETMNRLRNWAQSLSGSVSMIVCTHKDLVKLCTDRIGGIDLAALVIELRLQATDSDPELAIEKVLDAVSRRNVSL